MRAERQARSRRCSTTPSFSSRRGHPLLRPWGCACTWSGSRPTGSSPLPTYELHVLRSPSRLLEAEDLAVEEKKPEEQAEEREIFIDRFQPASRNYVNDIGLALMYSGGLPDHPTVVGRSTTSSSCKLRLPASTAACSQAWSRWSSRRSPIPGRSSCISRPSSCPSPSIPPATTSSGQGLAPRCGLRRRRRPHCLQPIPAPGNFYGQTFPSSPVELGHVTQYGPLAAGYFVSVSIDLVGLSHLIVDQTTEAHRPRLVESGAPRVQK